MAEIKMINNKQDAVDAANRMLESIRKQNQEKKEEINNFISNLSNAPLEESMAEDTKITDEERGALYKHYTKLNDTFIREFRKNNKEQIKKYNELMNK